MNLSLDLIIILLVLLHGLVQLLIFSVFFGDLNWEIDTFLVNVPVFLVNCFRKLICITCMHHEWWNGCNFKLLEALHFVTCFWEIGIVCMWLTLLDLLLGLVLLCIAIFLGDGVLGLGFFIILLVSSIISLCLDFSLGLVVLMTINWTRDVVTLDIFAVILLVVDIRSDFLALLGKFKFWIIFTKNVFLHGFTGGCLVWRIILEWLDLLDGVHMWSWSETNAMTFDLSIVLFLVLLVRSELFCSLCWLIDWSLGQVQLVRLLFLIVIFNILFGANLFLKFLLVDILLSGVLWEIEIMFFPFIIFLVNVWIQLISVLCMMLDWWIVCWIHGLITLVGDHVFTCGMIVSIRSNFSNVLVNFVCFRLNKFRSIAVVVHSLLGILGVVSTSDVLNILGDNVFKVTISCHVRLGTKNIFIVILLVFKVRWLLSSFLCIQHSWIIWWVVDGELILVPLFSISSILGHLVLFNQFHLWGDCSWLDLNLLFLPFFGIFTVTSGVLDIFSELVGFTFSKIEVMSLGFFSSSLWIICLDSIDLFLLFVCWCHVSWEINQVLVIFPIFLVIVVRLVFSIGSMLDKRSDLHNIHLLETLELVNSFLFTSLIDRVTCDIGNHFVCLVEIGITESLGKFISFHGLSTRLAIGGVCWICLFWCLDIGLNQWDVIQSFFEFIFSFGFFIILLVFQLQVIVDLLGLHCLLDITSIEQGSIIVVRSDGAKAFFSVSIFGENGLLFLG